MNLPDGISAIATVSPRQRRGSVYLLVLATTTVIATLIGGTLYAQTQRLRSERVNSDASKARLAAFSGLDVIRAWIAQDANWRSNRTSGRWASNLTLGEAKVDLDIVDSVDGSLSNHPYHPLIITATARIGQAEQIYSATLTAKPTPIDALAYVIHTAGQLRVEGSGTLQLRSATASTNGALRNDNVIEGNVLARSVTTAGTVYGSTTLSATARGFPSAANIDQLIALGTILSTDRLDNNDTLSPYFSAYSSVNALGVYVVNCTGDFNIKDLSVSGTLIVTVPSGKKVTLDGTNVFTPTSSDLPALVVRGDLDVKSGTTINGLLHVTRTLTFSDAGTVNGLVLCESAATSDAVKVSRDFTIRYDPGLYSYPPVGYASKVDMVLQPGSYQRVLK